MFRLFQGTAEALASLGGKIKHVLIAYFFSNISAENYQNQFMHVTVTEAMRVNFFETQYSFTECLQCFDTVGWVAGRASGL